MTVGPSSTQFGTQTLSSSPPRGTQNVTGIAPEAVGMELRLARRIRENIETKGRRYLIEGRLAVTHVDPHAIKATCRGTEQIHQLGYRDGSWSCSCLAKGRCSHIAALQLVTLPTETKENA